MQQAKARIPRSPIYGQTFIRLDLANVNINLAMIGVVAGNMAMNMARLYKMGHAQ